MMSESNKQQAVNKLTEIVANFTAMISTRMPDDVVDKLKQLKDAETSSMGKIIYHTMFDNMQKAIDLNRPACQDTGEIMFFVKVGSRFPLLGDSMGNDVSSCKAYSNKPWKRQPSKRHCVTMR
ncbi:hypothetical protein EIMP300_21770 [Escherichia coli]|uniref:L(+)-tartrate dehydratase subunit alpha n=1 Tax=Escherichia coli TaxID=562 RepID=A0A8S0FKI6_ECOLX|nr:hypothetical protein EIMP300_21770 [Escherichia coli]